MKDKQINNVLQNLNLNNETARKLQQIIKFSGKTNLPDVLEVVAGLEEHELSNQSENVAEFSHHGKDDQACVSYNGYKVFSNKNELQELSVNMVDKSRLIVGLKDYEEKSYNLKNLDDKEVSFNYESQNIYFDKPKTSHAQNVVYKFDKNNSLEKVDVELISNNKKSLITYNIKEIAKLLEENLTKNLNKNNERSL